jgi:formiminotetrahydrofolate cyclodeaminase
MAMVLRARKAQEDMAKGNVLVARAAERAAADAIVARERELDTSPTPAGGSAYAVVAALAARHSMAAAASAARRAHQVAEEETAAVTAELTEAAKRRQVIEKLVDRHLAEERAEELAAEQVVLDEIAMTARRRAEAQGVQS